MNSELQILLFSAASIGFLHTVLGPDHYIPFIVMAKARGWSTVKTFIITAICGVGHVMGSIGLGLIGISLGLALNELEVIESFRGNLAGWALISFGLIYLVWGIRKAYKNKPHKHIHVHSDGKIHNHSHQHKMEHAHVHDSKKEANITPWVLFVIFVLGPCEALIPLLMYPAATSSMEGMLLVTSVFGIVTVMTMVGLVLVLTYGVKRIPLGKFERYSHALAGGIILLSGISINLLGL